MPAEAGRVLASDVGRHFKIAASGGRSLKAALLGYERSRPREFWALRHVDFEINPGETFGIIGRNGSGKSTLLKILAQIFGPSEGSCEVGGRVSSLLELGAGFHPEFSAIENVYLSAAIYGIPRADIDRELEEIIAFAELEEFKDQPVKTFSSGMFARLGFSVAMHARPDVLLLDEALAVGDEAFVQKCFGRLDEHRRNGGTIVFVSHDPQAVEALCQRAIVLDHGQTVFYGGASDAILEYHRRLAAINDASPGAAHEGMAHGFGLNATTLHASGRASASFEEGEPIRIELTITSPRELPSLRVIIGIRGADHGHLLGSRSIETALSDSSETRIAFDMPDPPFRAGHFVIDALVRHPDSLATLAEERALAEFSVFSTRHGAEGPLYLAGDVTVSE